MLNSVEAGSSTQVKTERRSYALDGLRGLAALSVVFLHLLTVFFNTSFPQYHWIDRLFHALSFTPITVIWDGNAAVLIFFVLSGFALHRMLDSGNLNYLKYAIRRIIRLWLPYAAAIALAISSVYFIGSYIIPGQSNWMNAKLGTVLTGSLIFQHVLMIGVFKFNSLDFVIWSLVQEMRISLLFPLIYIALNKYPASRVLLTSIIIEFIALTIIALGHGRYTDVSYIVTIKYHIFFVAGALISAQEDCIKKYMIKISVFNKILIYAAILVLYTNCLKIPTLFPTLIGAIGIVILSISDVSVIMILNVKLIQFLGKISYSLYLLHAVILLGFINLLYPKWPFSEIVMISIPTIFFLSFLFNRFVEMPSIKLSRAAGKAF